MTEIFPDQFAGQNWLITPAALAVGKAPPRQFLIRNGCWSCPASW